MDATCAIQNSIHVFSLVHINMCPEFWVHITLPIPAARIPASVNLQPAKRICDAVSAASTSNSRYPILIQGNALPHNRQHKSAPNQTTTVFCIHSCFIFNPLIYILPPMFIISDRSQQLSKQ